MALRLGRGGMGEVWRADDLVLNTPVALKRLFAKGPEARRRLLHEVRLARQITHPAVCRVFDVGEAEDEVFYSMELIEGEDLAALLGHAGRLPSAKVIELAHQLCDGLSAAHAANVLHRDLKPANVLIDGHGQVRITDFGIAVSQADADAAPMVGTPEYMAPEQLVQGARLTEQTDIYALGLILFELVTGTHALKAGTIVSPVPPSRLVPEIDPRLDKAILRAISPEPRDRFGSAREFAAALPRAAREAAPAAAPRWRWAVAALGLAAIAVAAAVWLVPSTSGHATLTEQDTIVLADFQNRTGEPVFDRALKVALAVALEQSPFLKVFPDDRAAETLRLMGRPATEPVTRAVAREIAQREHLKALIAGTISRLGQHYVIAIEATNAETGDTMAIEQIEAATREDVLTALGGATSKLRETLGESLASVQKFDVPLPRATTPSLEALSAYARALDDGRRMDLRLSVIPQLKRALELDPDFAMAHAQISAVYTNTGQTSLAPQHARRAFELRDRVSDRERFFIAFRYQRDATQDWEQARDIAQAWTTAYPREALAANALGIARMRFGDYEGAIEPIRQAMRLDPKFAPLYSNLAGSLLALGRIDEAKAVLRQGEAQGIDYFNAHRMAYLIGFIENDPQTIELHTRAGLRLDQNNSAFGWRAHALSFHGRVDEAHEQFRVGSEVASQNGFKEVAARLAIEDLEGRALVGRCGDVSPEVARALAWSRDNFALERSARALIICDRESEAARLLEELKTRYPEATLVHRITLPMMEALIALNHGQPDRAVKALEPVRPFDHAPWSGYFPALIRGQAYLALRDAGSAKREFQTILGNRGEDPDSLVYPLAQLGMARASVLAGDADGGRAEYAKLRALWPEPDPDLPGVDEMRRVLGSAATKGADRVN